MRLTNIALCCAAALLTACAALPIDTVPNEYKGPVAYVSDTVNRLGRGEAEFFVLTAIDGTPIQDALFAARKSSAGAGFNLKTEHVVRQVVAKPSKVSLRATYGAAAPIQELLYAGKYKSVEGDVQFDPQPGSAYAVVGTISAESASVWIEDKVTGKPVTQTLSSK